MQRWAVGLLSLLLGVLLPTQGVHGAVITATACTPAAVQTAVNSAADGDTVIIPNGSCTWASGITTSKQLILSGQTKGSVLLTHSAAGNNLFTLTTGGTYKTEVRNLNFLAGSGTGRYLDIGGSGQPPLIHDNYFSIPDFQ